MPIETHSQSVANPPSAILVGVQLAGDDGQRLADELNELESLLRTLNIPVKGRIIQRRQKLTASCLIGSGKVDEIKNFADQSGASMVVFDRPLSAPQVRNLEQMTKRQIYDRTGIILEIFSRHARTPQAKTQVELARLEYLLPRLTGQWTHLDRQKGGGTAARGMGEKQIEVDRRLARERMARLRRQLDQIQKDKVTQRKAREGELKVALVGYTNSGKTTLMKMLTKATTEGKDELFATLDTNVKTIDPRTRPKILLSDTVGFIRNLPHGLVESFKSTLDEVREADLLLLVVDVSHENYAEQMQVTQEVLTEIGAGNVPQMIVFNKVDASDDPILAKVLRAAHKNSMVMSAYNMRDVQLLRDRVYDIFKNNLVEMTLEIPVNDQAVLSLIYNTSLILATDYSENGKMWFHIRTSRSVAPKLNGYIAHTGVNETERPAHVYDNGIAG